MINRLSGDRLLHGISQLVPYYPGVLALNHL